MAFKHLKMEELEAFEDGYVVRHMNALINDAAKDCYDRFHDLKPRKITLEIQLVPVATQSGSVKDIKVRMSISGKKPGWHTDDVTCRIGQNGALAYNPDSPDDFDQKTIFDGPDGK